MSWLGLPQTVTYWEQTDTDVNGDKSYNAGVAVSARWKEHDGIVTDERGEEQKTTHIVYTETNIPKRSMLVLEDQNGVALPLDGAREVMDVKYNPSMDTLYRVVM